MTHKPFCYWHSATKENPRGTDCTAHIAEGRVLKCPYTPEHIKYDSDGIYISQGGRVSGECQNFCLLPEIKDEMLKRIPNEQKVKTLVEILIY